MVWNWMLIEQLFDDRRMKPIIGPGELSREEAHTYVQEALDAIPELHSTAELWRPGAEDDVVYWGPWIFAIYEHPTGEDPCRAAIEWLEGLADGMRKFGFNVGVAAYPRGKESQ
jgi:hypothetical protein